MWGEAAIPHSSVRYQEGTAIEAEETQRQLDHDYDFTETPVISKYLEELRLLCCRLSVSMQMCVGGWGRQGLTSDVLCYPSLSNFF